MDFRLLLERPEIGQRDRLYMHVGRRCGELSLGPVGVWAMTGVKTLVFYGVTGRGQRRRRGVQ